MHEIKLANPAAAARAISELHRMATPKEDGTWQVTASPYQRMAFELLMNIVSITPPIPDRTLRALAYRSIFKWLRFKKYREDPNHARGYLGAVQREFRILERKRARFNVLMLMTCDIADLAPFGAPSVLGTDVSIQPWTDLRELDMAALWQNIRAHRLVPFLFHDFDLPEPPVRTRDFTPLLVKSYTFGPEAAVEVAQEAFDLFRACLNLPVIAGHFSYFRSAPKALSPIPPTPVYAVFSDAGEFITIYITNEQYEYKRVKIPANHAQAAQAYLANLNSVASRQVAEVYKRCLRLYQEAIDIESPQQSFLALWHVLEAIADVNGKGVSQRGIESRIATLIQPDPMIRDLIHVMVDRRNSLVHAGQFPQDPDPIYFSLKLITDIALSRLLRLAQEFDTSHHIEEYLSLASVDNTGLERKRSVIDFVVNSRSK